MFLSVCVYIAYVLIMIIYKKKISFANLETQLFKDVYHYCRV